MTDTDSYAFLVSTANADEGKTTALIESMDLNAPESFIDLVYSADCKQNYIGMGNPNASILIIGREPAHDLDTDAGRSSFHQDQELNKTNWRNLIEKTPIEGRCNPRFPFPNQRCFRQNESGQGTAVTWIWYQKLVDLIIGREYERAYSLRPVDFHNFCFHTDISEAAFKGLHTTLRHTKSISVKERSKELFSHPFFKRFPIVVLAIGADVGKYVPLDWCEKVLGFPVAEVEKAFDDGEGMMWINRDSQNNRILVHTHCLTQPSWEYIGKIRDIIWQDGHIDNCWPQLY